MVAVQGWAGHRHQCRELAKKFEVWCGGRWYTDISRDGMRWELTSMPRALAEGRHTDHCLGGVSRMADIEAMAIEKSSVVGVIAGKAITPAPLLADAMALTREQKVPGGDAGC
jgi:phosphoribosylformimino-5-aminoimidazole carboxamide ribonucleotide (ProFAR) isomerase